MPKRSRSFASELAGEGAAAEQARSLDRVVVAVQPVKQVLTRRIFRAQYQSQCRPAAERAERVPPRAE